MSNKQDRTTRADVLADKTMYIASNNLAKIGHRIGEVIVMVKVVDLVIKNNPHGRYVISLYNNSPFNFLWDGVIEKYGIEVLMDEWQPVEYPSSYELKHERYMSRMVHSIPFDTYIEPFSVISGFDAGRSHLNRDNFAGVHNVISNKYYRQEDISNEYVGDVSVGYGIIKCNRWSGGNGRVFIAPHENSQDNVVFTLGFWKDVVLGLLDRGIAVTVNSDGGFMDGFTHELHRRVFSTYSDLFDRVADHSVVACGNTGVGWVAAATETPLVAMEKDMGKPEFSFERCGVRSLVKTIREPDVDQSINSIAMMINRKAVA